VLSGPTDLGTLTTLLTSPPHDALYSLQTSELAYLANDPVQVTSDGEGASVAEDKVETVMKGVNALEDEGDVVRVWTNIAE
jgi:transcriptional/translational regulatory protein YebC/TACO1